MEKVSIRLISVNGALRKLNLKRLYSWKTELFSVFPVTDDDIVSFHEQYDYGQVYSVIILNRCLKCSEFDGLTVFISYEPLEDNQFSVLLENNRVVFSLYEIQDILRDAEIPLENHIISLLYTYSLMLLAYDDRRIPIDAEQLLAHHSLRKCLFDFRYNKSDIKYTSVQPKLCESCFENLKANGVPVDILYSVREELKGLQKDPYYKLTGFFKKHPVLSIILTTLVSFLLNVLCNIIC